jgi:hypothetical protein
MREHGQVYAPGNAYNDAGEFNWWFDPEAAQIVLRTSIPKLIVPLDCTNTVPLTKETYQQIADHQPSTIITELYQQAFAPFFGSAPPPYLPYIYDTIALGCLVNPSFATDSRAIWLDIDTVKANANTAFGSNYGKTIPYSFDPYPSIGVLSKSTVLFAINTPAFFQFYVDLLNSARPGEVSAPRDFMNKESVSSNSRKLVGKCLCGAVQVSIADEFLYAGYCHCPDCRASSGSAFSAYAGIRKEKVQLTCGGRAFPNFAKTKTT